MFPFDFLDLTFASVRFNHHALRKQQALLFFSFFRFVPPQTPENICVFVTCASLPVHTYIRTKYTKVPTHGTVIYQDVTSAC